VTLTDEVAENGPRLELQVIVKVSCSEAPEKTGFGSVIDTLPLVGRDVLGQVSFDPPPVLAQPFA
jgi:hypothetical protein